MQTDTMRVYKSLRRAGYTARDAWRTAKIMAQWRAAEGDGLVRLRLESEQESYASVYGEPEAYVDGNGRRVSAKQARRELHALLEQHGCWCAFSEWRADENAEWEQADSVGMLTGYGQPLDPRENAYVPDLMASALAALAAEREPSARFYTMAH